MAKVDLPELPSIIAYLVRNGVYTIYSLRIPSADPYILVTSQGHIHVLTPRGAISREMTGGRLAELPLGSAISLSDSAGMESRTIQINN